VSQLPAYSDFCFKGQKVPYPVSSFLQDTKLSWRNLTTFDMVEWPVTRQMIPKRRAARTPLQCRETTVLHGSKYKAKIDSWCCGQTMVLWTSIRFPKGKATVSLPGACTTDL